MLPSPYILALGVLNPRIPIDQVAKRQQFLTCLLIVMPLTDALLPPRWIWTSLDKASIIFLHDVNWIGVEHPLVADVNQDHSVSSFRVNFFNAFSGPSIEPDITS